MNIKIFRRVWRAMFEYLERAEFRRYADHNPDKALIETESYAVGFRDGAEAGINAALDTGTEFLNAELAGKKIAESDANRRIERRVEDKLKSRVDEIRGIQRR